MKYASVHIIHCSFCMCILLNIIITQLLVIGGINRGSSAHAVIPQSTGLQTFNSYGYNVGT